MTALSDDARQAISARHCTPCREGDSPGCVCPISPDPLAAILHDGRDIMTALDEGAVAMRLLRYRIDALNGGAPHLNDPEAAALITRIETEADR